MTTLDISNVTKEFETGGMLKNILYGTDNALRAVDDVSIKLENDTSVGLIGESGCGKTTLLRIIAGLYEPTKGEVKYNGDNIFNFNRKEWKQFRSDVQMIFQDPFNSINPRYTVREAIIEPLKIQNMNNIDKRLYRSLERVKLEPPEKYLNQTPQNLSGGEKQRVSIARALALDPNVILADEPVSMLDVSTQASILNLLSDLQKEEELTMIYVSHDLSTVSYVCDKINVMYLGRIVEQAQTGNLIQNPKHPYTRALVQAVPHPDPHTEREKPKVKMIPPNTDNIDQGCRFKERCPEKMDICENKPRFVSETGDNRKVACHLYYDHEQDASDKEAGR